MNKHQLYFIGSIIFRSFTTAFHGPDPRQHCSMPWMGESEAAARAGRWPACALVDAGPQAGSFAFSAFAPACLPWHALHCSEGLACNLHFRKRRLRLHQRPPGPAGQSRRKARHGPETPSGRGIIPWTNSTNPATRATRRSRHAGAQHSANRRPNPQYRGNGIPWRSAYRTNGACNCPIA